jgi:hypothetical protein
LYQKPDGGNLGAEEGLRPAATFPADRRHLNGITVGVNRYHRDDTAVGEEDIVERTIRLQENLVAFAANLF